MKAIVPPLAGLVLAGGKSERMGRDKGDISYHGKPQRDHLFELLSPVCESVFVSFREGQTGAENLPVLYDSFTGLGPFGAILSAFRAFPNHAWLVVACDLPLLDKPAIDFLTQNRNPSAVATAFHNPATGFPDPLVTIWEPKSYPILLQFLAQGYSCPRKVLINSEIETLQPPDPEILRNANTPADLEEIMSRLKPEKKG